MGETDEVTRWIGQLGDGDEEAARRIWDRYFARLVRYARRKLDGMPTRAADEEDVALSAMHSFCQGLRAGKFHRVDDRDDLWKLLVTLTARKACAERRSHKAVKRGAGRVRGESVFLRVDADDSRPPGIGDVLGREPTPELAAMVADNTRRMLDALEEESLRLVALHTLEGYGVAEVAEKLGCTRRTVERKLERVRSKWAREGRS